MSNNRKRSLDHEKKTQRPMVEDEVIANQLEALLTPAITNQENYYRHDSRVPLPRTRSWVNVLRRRGVARQLGLRDRILNLPLMVAAVLTLLP